MRHEDKTKESNCFEKMPARREEEARADLEIWQIADARPCFIGRCAEIAENAKQFVDFTVAGKEGATVDHLGEYASHGPYVHRRGIVLGAKEDFRSTVPQGDHLRERDW